MVSTVRKWNGYLWKITSNHNDVTIERFASNEFADFPYSVVKLKLDVLIRKPSYNPTACDQDTNEAHIDSGQLSFEINNMCEAFTLIVDIMREGQRV